MKNKYILKKQTQELYKICPIKTEIRSFEGFFESRAGQGINEIKTRNFPFLLSFNSKIEKYIYVIY